uniref:Uncharacterized protein n=1 Tax=Panagrolaimus sp. ES5 TaxID=591445 RepID=A0AC34G6Q4_9BILA
MEESLQQQYRNVKQITKEDVLKKFTDSKLKSPDSKGKSPG